MARMVTIMQEEPSFAFTWISCFCQGSVCCHRKTKQVMYLSHNNEECLCDYWHSGNATSISVINGVYILTLIISKQIAFFALRIILSIVACQSLPYFSTLSQTLHDFWKKIIEHKMCVLFLLTTFV